VIVVRNEVLLCNVIDHVTLTYDLETCRHLGIVARGVGNLPTNFDVSRMLRSRLICQHLSDASCDLVTFTPSPLTLEVTALIRVFVVHLCTKFELRRPSVWKTLGI